MHCSIPCLLPAELQKSLVVTANQLATIGKGILAADENNKEQIENRFSLIEVENTYETRRAYRELIFGTQGIQKYISGVIMFDETLLEHKTKDGSKFLRELCIEKGILVGACVDVCLVPLEGSNGESTQSGLDTLDQRCKKYFAAGARFAKWRGVYAIDLQHGIPSELAIRDGARCQARAAAICQANGLCPIVEPDIMTDGTHDIETCARISEHILSTIIKELHNNGVCLEGAILKPNMITPGNKNVIRASPNEVAQYTIRTLLRTIPASIPGVMFLSGGQSDEEATVNLDAINKLAKLSNNVPWILSFSFGRSLQTECRKEWRGKEENFDAARKVFYGRCKACGEASTGDYKAI